MASLMMADSPTSMEVGQGHASQPSCPDLTAINSIVKLNKTHSLMLSHGKLYYLELTKTGYKIPKNQLVLSLNEEKLNKKTGPITSMINLNRILFVFQVSLNLAIE